jgi:hypothetical protein
MRRNTGLINRVAAIAVIGAVVIATPARGQERRTMQRLELELEGGLVWQSRNVAQIPNDASGTRFSLVSLVGNGPWPAARGYVTWNVNERHALRLLVGAPPVSVFGSDWVIVRAADAHVGDVARVSRAAGRRHGGLVVHPGNLRVGDSDSMRSRSTAHPACSRTICSGSSSRTRSRSSTSPCVPMLPNTTAALRFNPRSFARFIGEPLNARLNSSRVISRRSRAN